MARSAASKPGRVYILLLVGLAVLAVASVATYFINGGRATFHAPHIDLAKQVKLAASKELSDLTAPNPHVSPLAEDPDTVVTQPSVPSSCVKITVHYPNASNYTMCLHNPPDFISRVVARDGFWPECARHPGLMQRSLEQRSLESLKTSNVLTGDHAQPSVETPEGSQKPGLFVDVGANIGSCSLFMAANGYEVHAFEVNPRNQAIFLESIKMNAQQNKGFRITLHPVGVGEAPGSFSLVEDSDNFGNSILAYAADLKAVKQLAHSTNESISNLANGLFEVVRLDDILDAKTAPYIHLIKMDCQGCELKAMKGMVGILKEKRVGIIDFEYCPAFLQTATGELPISLLLLFLEYDYVLWTEGGVALGTEAEIMAWDASHAAAKEADNNWNANVLALRRGMKPP